MSDTTDQPGGGLLGKLKGKAKELGGEIVGNDDLAAEGRLEQATVAAADEAVARDRAADVVAERAEVDRALHQNAVEAERLKSEKAQAEREARLEQERVAEEARLEAQLDHREQAVEQQAARQQQAVAREELDVLSDRAEAEQKASRAEAEARAARAAAEALDAARPDAG
jgi:uncharacterized protein YjbJ (UPF0337 family)